MGHSYHNLFPSSDTYSGDMFVYLLRNVIIFHRKQYFILTWWFRKSTLGFEEMVCQNLFPLKCTWACLLNGVWPEPCAPHSLPMEKTFVCAAILRVLSAAGYWFVPLIKTQVRLNSNSRQEPLLYFTLDESASVNSYASPCLRIMTVTSATTAAPIPIIPTQENCPKTWVQSVVRIFYLWHITSARLSASGFAAIQWGSEIMLLLLELLHAPVVFRWLCVRWPSEPVHIESGWGKQRNCRGGLWKCFHVYSETKVLQSVWQKWHAKKKNK